MVEDMSLCLTPETTSAKRPAMISQWKISTTCAKPGSDFMFIGLTVEGYCFGRDYDLDSLCVGDFLSVFSRTPVFDTRGHYLDKHFWSVWGVSEKHRASGCANTAPHRLSDVDAIVRTYIEHDLGRSCLRGNACTAERSARNDLARLRSCCRQCLP